MKYLLLKLFALTRSTLCYFYLYLFMDNCRSCRWKHDSPTLQVFYTRADSFRSLFFLKFQSGKNSVCSCMTQCELQYCNVHRCVLFTQCIISRADETPRRIGESTRVKSALLLSEHFLGIAFSVCVVLLFFFSMRLYLSPWKFCSVFFSFSRFRLTMSMIITASVYRLLHGRIVTMHVEQRGRM